MRNFDITAYDLIQTDSGIFTRNDNSFFQIYKTKLEGVVA